LIDDLIRQFPALDVDDSTAGRSGQIKATLEMAGTPIPENDMWIAALATRWGVTLITRDNHFNRLPHLALEMW